MANTLGPALDNTRRCRPERFSLLHLCLCLTWLEIIMFIKRINKNSKEERIYVKMMLMKSEGDEAVALSLERIRTTRSSGRHSKRSCLFLECFHGLLIFLSFSFNRA